MCLYKLNRHYYVTEEVTVHQDRNFSLPSQIDQNYLFSEHNVLVKNSQNSQFPNFGQDLYQNDPKITMIHGNYFSIVKNTFCAKKAACTGESSKCGADRKGRIHYHAPPRLKSWYLHQLI